MKNICERLFLFTFVITFAKRFIEDVWRGSEYTSAIYTTIRVRRLPLARVIFIIENFWNIKTYYYSREILFTHNIQRYTGGPRKILGVPRVYSKGWYIRKICVTWWNKKFRNIHKKQLCESLFFNKVTGLRPETLLKETLAHVFFCEHLFLQNFSGDCFWIRWLIFAWYEILLKIIFEHTTIT